VSLLASAVTIRLCVPWSSLSRDNFLRLTELPMPKPGVGQVLVRVSACAVCRTDLHVVDGELPNPKLPLVPGHEIVGRIAEVGAGVDAVRQSQAVKPNR